MSRFFVAIFEDMILHVVLFWHIWQVYDMISRISAFRSILLVFTEILGDTHGL